MYMLKIANNIKDLGRNCEKSNNINGLERIIEKLKDFKDLD